MHDVEWFESADLAIEYARRRTWDSVEEQLERYPTPDALLDAWVTFGESCFVHQVGKGGTALYAARDELDHFIARRASQTERDWGALEPRHAARPDRDDER